jgi:hypothetical protein
MSIRTFQPGDEAAQVGIYNEASAQLPKFKPATLDEIRRRCRAPDFDPGTRFFAMENGQIVGYASFHSNGRVSYPWCREGAESQQEALFEAVLAAMRARGIKRAFVAYRADWKDQQTFFQRHGFSLAREMVNFWLDPMDLPTPGAGSRRAVTAAEPRDIPAILELVPSALRVASAAGLERHLLHNPYFSAESVLVLRDGADQRVRAAAVVILNPSYADARQVDASMPCFRLGAFGTEGMQVKRMNGLFSLLARDDADLNPLGLDLLTEAAFRLHAADVPALAAQSASDVAHLLRFYQGFFRRQGSFPVLERDL